MRSLPLRQEPTVARGTYGLTFWTVRHATHTSTCVRTLMQPPVENGNVESYG